jgi:hypothetical protein
MIFLIIYQPTDKWFDIALLRVTNPIIFSNTVTSIPLDFTRIDTATDVEIWGWGRSASGGNLMNTLQRGLFRIMPLQACRESFPLVMRNLIIDSHICTQFNLRSTCPGNVNFYVNGFIDKIM